MEKKFVGSTKELNIAKSKGISSKVKHILAAALIGGNLIAVGTPIEASAYTHDQIATHQRHVQELKNLYDNISEKSTSALNDLLKKGEISIEQYNNSMNNLKKLQETQKFSVTELQGKLHNITDKNIISMKMLSPQEGDTKERVQLNLNNISSLNKEQIEYLEKKYHIDSIVLNRAYHLDEGDFSDATFVYSTETYKKLLTTIDEKFSDLKENKNLTELEKVTIVLKRMENIKYDYNALNLSIDKDDTSTSKIWTSRNMVDPLFNNTGICAGYSDLFKNVMSYLNIESKEIHGYVKGAETINTLPGKDNHAWNQVKIDGKWYNLDITQLNTRPSRLAPNQDHQYLFVSDSELNDFRSKLMPSEYQPIFGLHENATQSLSQQEIDKALVTAIEYEQKKLKHDNSLFAQTGKKIAALKNKLSGKKTDKNITVASENTNTTTNTREEFTSYLSNNGKYRQQSNTAISQNTISKDNSLELDEDERS